MSTRKNVGPQYFVAARNNRHPAASGHKILRPYEYTYKHLCAACSPQIKKRTICNSCGAWDTSLIEGINTCYFCLQNPFSARILRSCTNYDDVAENLIKTLKYNKKFLLASVIGKILAEQGISLFPKTDWDLALALPSHKEALRTRGFSHMHLVLKEFCKITDLQYSFSAIQNKSQKGYQSLSKLEDRYSHMKNAFRTKPAELKEKRILLLDDVITTGASLESATKELLNSGAISVDILSFARSSKFSKNRRVKPLESI